MIGLGVAAVLAAATSVGGAASAHAPKLRLGERSAIPNQVVTMAGPGVGGKRVKVTVRGKNARVLRGKGKPRFVVPNVKPGRAPVVVKTSKRKLRGRLRIRNPGRFTGSIEVTLDTAQAAQATIGPAGGTLSATGGDGSRYTLTIPQDALATDTVITATPVKSIKGLPVKSGHVAAVQFGPDGLVFAKPARLEIVPAEGSPQRMAGFSYDGSGANVGFQPGEPSGDALVLEVEHFSGEGAFERSIDDFLVFVGDLVRRAIAARALTQSEVEYFIDALRSFRLTLNNCRSDPTCAFLAEVARRALIQLGEAECIDPETAQGSELIRCIWDGLRLEGDYQLMGLDDPDSLAVLRRVREDRGKAVQRLVREVKDSTAGDPMGNYANEVFLTPRDRGVGRITDREPDSHVSNAEIALGLAGNTALLGDEAQTNELTEAIDGGLRRELDDAARLCETDVRTATARLERLLKYAGGQLREDTAAARVACVPKVKIAPTETTVVSGRSQTFTATANDGETAFSWSASAGSITQDGLFTAPSDPGDVTVTVALPAHPDVKASATVHVTASGYTFGEDAMSLVVLGFVRCDTDATALNGGRVYTGEVRPISEPQFTFNPTRSCSTGTAKVEGIGDRDASFSNTSSPLRLAFGLTAAAGGGTSGPNEGGTNGTWLEVEGTMHFDFNVGVDSGADCNANFQPNFLRVDGDPHVTINRQGGPEVLDLGPPGQVQGQATLAPGAYHLDAFARYIGDDSTPTGTNGTGFSFSCEITPAG